MPTYYPPVFSKGKASEETVTAFSAGDTTITGINQVNFPTGTHVWTAEQAATETQVEYRGKVTTVATGTIVVERAAASATTAPNAWKASASWASTYLHNMPESRRDLGVDTHRTLGGSVFRTQVSEALETVVTRYDQLPTGDVDDWWDFVGDSLSDGVDQFTYSFYDFRKRTNRVCTVSLLDNESSFRERQIGVAQNLVIEVAIQTEGTYT